MARGIERGDCFRETRNCSLPCTGLLAAVGVLRATRFSAGSLDQDKYGSATTSSLEDFVSDGRPTTTEEHTTLASEDSTKIWP